MKSLAFKNKCKYVQKNGSVTWLREGSMEGFSLFCMLGTNTCNLLNYDDCLFQIILQQQRTKLLITLYVSNISLSPPRQ